MNRGYFGIGVVNMKNSVNYGTLFRSAHCFGANFLFLVGKRFKHQCSNTTCSERHIPLFEYQDINDFIDHIPYNCVPVCIEITTKSRDIRNFVHPERAIYILGQEDGSLPIKLTDKYTTIKIPTSRCLNVSVVGSIVLYDRVRSRDDP